jgi:ADP-ribose pyrophosphatase
MAANKELARWEVLGSKIIYSARPWVEVSVQRVRLPDGRVVDDYHQIWTVDYTVVLAQIADGRVIVERQYKHGVRQVSLALPSGAIEAGEDPLTAARRELLEETGYHSDEWYPIGTFVQNSNYGCGTAHLFIARNARMVALPVPGDLEEMEILLRPLQDLLDALLHGELVLLNTAATIAIAALQLQNLIPRENQPR